MALTKGAKGLFEWLRAQKGRELEGEVPKDVSQQEQARAIPSAAGRQSTKDSAQWRRHRREVLPRNVYSDGAQETHPLRQ
jgi:hypothetical protein